MAVRPLRLTDPQPAERVRVRRVSEWGRERVRRRIVRGARRHASVLVEVLAPFGGGL